MADFWKSLFDTAAPSGVEVSARVEVANLDSVGKPNTAAPGIGDDGMALDLTPNYSKAGQKLVLKRASLPTLTATNTVIDFIKQLRSQTRVRRELERLANYMVMGLRIKGTPEVQAWFSRAEMYKQMHRIAFELLTLGWCVVYLNEDKKSVNPNITIMHNVAVKRGIDGAPRVWLYLDDLVKNVVRTQGKQFPKYWSKSVDSPFGIDITRVYDNSGAIKQGGAYFISMPCEPEDVYPVPPLFALLGSVVDTERMLNDVGAAAEKLVPLLTQIRLGNELGQDLRSGRIKAVEGDRVTKVSQTFTAAKTTGTFVGPGDIEVLYKYPTANPFITQIETGKYLDSTIREGIGLPDFQNVPSEGAAAYLAKSLFPDIEFMRKGILQQSFLSILLLDIADRVPGADTARTLWSMDGIWTKTEKLNEAKFRWLTGGMSIQSTNEQFDADYDYAAEIAQKTLEQKDEKIIPLIWEPSQGLSDIALKQAASTPATPVTPATGTPDKKGTGKKTPGPDPNGPSAGRPTKN